MNPGQCGLFFERLGVITMSTDKVSVHGSWASRWVFIFAATGSAVGLGSIWKFPYMVGVYGGGAFVLMFLACIALIGAPVMLAETLIGRRARQSPANALKVLATEATALLHGRDAANMAAETARQTFEQGAIAENLPTVEVAPHRVDEVVAADRERQLVEPLGHDHALAQGLREALKRNLDH